MVGTQIQSFSYQDKQIQELQVVGEVCQGGQAGEHT